MVTISRKSTFDERLIYCQQFKPTYRGALANHLPMAIIAMDAIGADLKEIDHFIDNNRTMLETIEPTDFRIDVDNWTQYLGQRDAFSGYRNYFLSVVECDGWQKVVADHFESLVEGISASAFHCLIRLGLGIRQNSSAEVAIAMAYFASEYQSLGDASRSAAGEIQLTNLLDQLADEAKLRHRTFEASNIIERLNLVAAHPDFQKVARLLDRCSLEISELSDFALRLFASTCSFTALHGVTSCHALRWVLPFVHDNQRCLRLYTRALLCAYVSIGTPDVAQWDALDVSAHRHRSWQWLFRQAIRSFNEHKIKMVFSCYDEFKNYSHEGYQYCAALAIESDV